MTEVSFVAFGVGVLSVAIVISIVLFGIARFLMAFFDHGYEIKRNARDIDSIDGRVSDTNRKHYKLLERVDELEERMTALEKLMSEFLVDKITDTTSKSSPKRGKS